MMNFNLTGPSPAPPANALTVTQLVDRIKNAVRISVGHQWVEGEISNLRVQSSGHSYFTLKDAGAQIACVFFKQRSSGCRIILKEGIKVRVYGEATMYEQRGQIQLVLTKIEPAGEGDLQARYLELKNRLQTEGLFAAERKKEIPGYPAAIGLITSPTGAAIQDIRHVLEGRAPWVRVYLLPVLVQGAEAAGQIAAAINSWNDAPANGLPVVDTLIVARGGGSIEDLWAFNEEVVARAIASSLIPVVSGVGHETDFTIADFVADLRAPTPTAAAMMATPDGRDILQRLNTIQTAIIRRARQTVRHGATQLLFYERSRLSDPWLILQGYEQLIDDLEETLRGNASESLRSKTLLLQDHANAIRSRHPRLRNEQRRHRLDRLESSLKHTVRQKLSPIPAQIAFLQHRLAATNRERIQACSSGIRLLESRLAGANPLKTLEKGFALVRNNEGRIIKSPDDAQTGDLLDITVRDGTITARTE